MYNFYDLRTVGYVFLDDEIAPIKELATGDFGFILSNGYSDRICPSCEFLLTSIPEALIQKFIYKAHEHFDKIGGVEYIFKLKTGYAVKYVGESIMHIYDSNFSETTTIDFDLDVFLPEEEGYELQ